MQDIVQPKGNEEHLIQRAEQLGFTSLLFVYSKPVEQKKFSFNVTYGILINDKTPRKEILNYKKMGYAIILNATQSTFRSYLERGWITHVIGAEDLWEKDSLHYPKSGINQVIGKLLHKHKVTTVFPVNMLSKAPSKKNTTLLKRVGHNIRLSKKFGFCTTCATMAKDVSELRGQHDLQSIAKVLAKSKI